MTEQKKSFDDFEAAKIVVEALEKFNDEERKRIIKWACEKLGTNYIVDENKNESNNFQVIDKQISTEKNISKKIVNIKTFVDNKKPRNDAQFVAVVAYFYKFEAGDEEKKDFIDSESLNYAARLADHKRFPKPAATLNNVYNQSGFLDRTTETGKYKINTVGENLVAMVLPNKEGKKNIKKKKRAVNKK